MRFVTEHSTDRRNAGAPAPSLSTRLKLGVVLAMLISSLRCFGLAALPLISSNLGLNQEWAATDTIPSVAPALPGTENLPDLSRCVLVMTMDGNISLVSAYRTIPGREADAGEHAPEEAEVVWSISSGGGIIASNQNPSQIYRYSIVPTLDGDGLVYIEGGASGDGIPAIRRLPLSPRQFAENIGSYSHTPDGVTYWKESSQTLLFINLLTGEVERLGAGSSNSGTGNKTVAASDHPVLVLSRVTTTVHAADVMSRQEIFNFTYSEVVPGSLLQYSTRADKVPGTNEDDVRESLTDAETLLHAYVDGTLRGRFGRVVLGSVAVRAYAFGRTIPARGEFVRGHGPLRSGNASHLMLKELPIVQLIGDEESTIAGSSLVLRPKFPSSVLTDSITTAFQDPILARAIMAAEGTEDTQNQPKPVGYITTLLDGGDQFGSFAVSILRPESPLIVSYDRSYLPAPTSDSSKPSSALVRSATPSATPAGWNPFNLDTGGDNENLWAPDEADVCARPFIGYAENDLDMFCMVASRKAVPDDGLILSPTPPPTVTIVPVLETPERDVVQIVAFVVAVQVAVIATFRALWKMFGKSSNNPSGVISVEAPPPPPANEPPVSVSAEPSSEQRVAEQHPGDDLVARSGAPGVTRVVGNILLTEDLLGVGSNNTLVYSGYTSELGVLRPAAIKQLVRSNYSAALKEIENLKKLSAHDNILNYYLCEQNDHFLFMALQLCRMSLRDFIGCLQRIPALCDQSLHATSAPPDCVRASFRQLADAVAHLHKRGVVHRDIKPHNILLDEIRPEDPLKVENIHSVADISKFKLKLSDLGLSKGVAGDDESFGSQSLAYVQSMGTEGVSAGGLPRRDAAGTLGWQAPEVVRRRLAAKERQSVPEEPHPHIYDGEVNEEDAWDPCLVSERDMSNYNTNSSGSIADSSVLRLTNRMDIFSLGCVLHFTLLPGMHPFGEGEQRDSNIVAGRHDLRGLAFTPDALNLVEAMVASRPQLRPSSIQVCAHPFFWPSQRRLEFLELLYARLRRDGERSRIVRDFDMYSRDVLLPHAVSRDTGSVHWGACLSADFRHEIENPPHGIVYDTASVYSCLRFIRHKKSHFDEIIGRTRHQLSLPEGYCRYFESRFPRLLTYCVWFATRNLTMEPDFDKFKLQLLADSPFFSSTAPPAAVAGPFSPKDPSDTRSRYAAIERRPIESETDLITEVKLPRRVLESLDAGPSRPDARSRGYYYVDSVSKAYLTQLRNVGQNNASAPPVKPLSQPALSPSSPSAGEWRRGVAAGLSSPSAAPSRAAEMMAKPTVSLLISNVHIPPMRPESRPAHITKALDGDRYRTELCRDWEESGYSRARDIARQMGAGQPKRQHCGFRRGQKLCDYAHGPLELRCKGIQRLSYYVSAASTSTSGSTDGPSRRQVVRYSEGDAVGRWGIGSSSSSNSSSSSSSAYDEACAAIGPLLEARRRLAAANTNK